MAELANKQDLHESKVAESEKWIQKAVNPANKGNLHKALHVAQGEKIPKAKIAKATHSKNPKLRHMAQFAKNVANEGTCSGCGCSPCKCDSMEESAFQAAIGKKKYGNEGMKALQKAGREHASDKTMSNIRNKYDKYDESQGMADEGNAFTGKLASTPKGGSFKLGDKTFKDTSSLEEGICPTCDCRPCKCNEGNAFTGALARTPKGGKFKVGNKEFTDTSSLEEKKEPRSKGTAFDKEHMDKVRKEKEAETHGRYDVKDTGYSKRYTRKAADTDIDKDDEVKSDAPKKKGRPKSTKPKGDENVTKGSYKYKMVNGKRVLKDKVKEDGMPITDRGEYDDEAGMAKDSLHTIVRHAKELENALRSNENMPEWVQEKIGQIKGMMSSVTDYILSTHERGVEQATGREGVTVMPEGWRGGMLGEPSVVKTRTSKNADATQEALAGLMAIATRGGPGMDPRTQQYLLQISKTLHKALAKPESTELDEKAVSKAQRKFMGMAHAMQKGEKIKGASPELKKVAKTMKPSDTHDFAATKLKGLPEKVKAKKESKKEEVEETTTAGSVATAVAAPKAGKGMQFGKGVYESIDREVEALMESMNVSVNMSTDENGEPHKSITVSAEGAEADVLAQLLKAAGIDHQAGGESCPTCGSTPCGCEQQVDENSPDWPTNTETLDADPNLRTYSGGLNGPKSSGQTTTPVLNRDPRRQASMEESVELERTLFKTWKNYKG